MGISFFRRKKQQQKEPENKIENRKYIDHLPVSQIKSNPFQPHEEFDQVMLEELANTMQSYGLLQPIVVRTLAENSYEVISGEHRIRAAKLLDWDKIPAIIDEFDDFQAATLSIIGNFQTEPLNPIEEAKSYQRLLDKYDLTQIKLANYLGKTQSYISAKLSLLRVSPEIQNYVVTQKLTQNHARTLISLNADQQNQLAQTIIEDNLTVEQSRQLVKDFLDHPQQATNLYSKAKKNVQLKTARNLKVPINTIKKTINLVEQTGTKVRYEESEDSGNYKIVIELDKG
ncbi:ParB/RepB/Spo0J family partition protein [Holzapfeliella sp. JNUCC 72]